METHRWQIKKTALKVLPGIGDKSRFVAALLGVVLLSAPAFGQGAELPQASVDTASTAPGGEVISVPTGGDLQAALDNASPGDVIELAAGGLYLGNYTLPQKAGSGWIHIRSSAYQDLPPPGTRVTGLDTTLMPKIVTPNGAPAITAAQAAHHYRFIGIEIHPAEGLFVNNLIMFGSGAETSEAELPHHIIFDRSYIHGDPVAGSRRGVALNGSHMAVIDSRLSHFKELFSDSQAIAGWNGPGPFKIANNYIEAAGNNVLFGGADPRIQDLVPSDIVVRNNHFFKPLSWWIEHDSYAGDPWQVKNLFELKNARRVLVTGNVFEHNWPQAQNGFGILFTVRNQGGTAPWSVVEDITFTRNIVRHMHSGINILGRDNTHPSQQTQRIVVRNNLFEDINGSWGGGSGRLFQILAGAAAVTIEHNTAFQDGPIIVADGNPTSGLIYRSNITMEGGGVLGTGTAVGMDTLNTYFPDAVYTNNVHIGGPASVYPAGNYFPATRDEVGFVNWQEGEYRLAEDSPYKDISAMGKDAGADFEALEAAAMGAVPGKAPARIEEHDSPVSCSPCAWSETAGSEHSAGKMISSVETGAGIIFDFTGTAVDWVGHSGEDTGIAAVYLDGVFQGQVDTYASPARSREVQFSLNGLAEGPHRLVIQVTGDYNANSGGPAISVDAFDVEADSGVVRFEEDHTSVYCSPCAWYPVAAGFLSGGGAMGTAQPGSSVSFDFTGTGVSWIGYRDGWSGIAEVYLDGEFQRTIDTYAPVDERQAVLYTTHGLAPGPHRLTIKVSGDSHPDSQGTGIWIDAFERLP